MWSACATTTSDAELPARAVHAPAERSAAFVPETTGASFATSGELSLDELLAYADARAPEVVVARARAGIADAGVVEARIVAPANPEIMVGVGPRVSGGAVGLDLEVGVSQRLEVVGEPAAREASAVSRREVARASVDEVRWATHVEVRRLVAQVMIVRERRALAARFVASAEMVHEVARKKVEVGEDSPLTLLVPEADLARAKGAQLQLAQTERAVLARLGGIIGWREDAPLALGGALSPVRRAPALDLLLERMASHHPALRTRELAVVAGLDAVALEDLEAFPEPTLGLSYAREGSPGQGPPADVWMLSVSTAIPLWRTNQGARVAARATLEAADRERDAAATTLRFDLTRAAVMVDGAAERVALYEESVMPSVERSLSQLQRAYELGEIDVHAVSQTRERLLAATQQYIDARASYYDAAATLEGLVGAEIWEGEVE